MIQMKGIGLPGIVKMKRFWMWYVDIRLLMAQLVLKSADRKQLFNRLTEAKRVYNLL